jgi:carboxyl-terminal processing protease
MDLLRKHAPVIALMLVIGVGSFLIGLQKGSQRLSSAASELDGDDSGRPSEVDFSAFWKTWNLINEKYVPASTTVGQVSDEEKVYGAIQGLADSLEDPYTVFFPPIEAEIFESDIRGNFEGVGMEVLAQSGAVTVIAPLKNSPAERAGMHAGDRIISIDDEPTAGLSTEDAVSKIRGPRGTSVKLTVVR